MSETPYILVVGLEVHVQLLTRTKLFCGCSTAFGQPPNSATCPVCLGLPGVLPVMNRQAFELALRAGLALNCTLSKFTKWDRKNYFYPDLPKSYQISQYDLPFSEHGHLDIETDAGSRRIGIIRAHLEEDAGKMIHDEESGKGDSVIDLNRTGTPLLEIVSEPDIRTPDEARAYLEEIRLLMRELGVSDCEMQEGSLRCDANVNLHIPQEDDSIIATPIVEVKNLNSIRSVAKALEYEGERQFHEFQQTGIKFGEAPKATAGWNESEGKTFIQRRKEEASDYRYFPDPDLVPVIVDDAWIERVRAEVGELPAEQRKRLVEDYALSEYDAGVLTRQGRAIVQYFEDVAKKTNDAKTASNWVTNQVLATLNESKQTLDEFPITAEALANLIEEVQRTGLNSQRSRDVFARMAETGQSAKDVMDELGIKVIGDENELREIIQRAIESNAKAAEDVKNGKMKAIGALKGFVMRETKGMAQMAMVEKILMEELQK